MKENILFIDPLGVLHCDFKQSYRDVIVRLEKESEMLSIGEDWKW